MKKALIFYGGWEGHAPRQSTTLWAGVLRTAGYEVTVSDTLDILLERETVLHQDLIIPNWTMGSMTDDQVASLEAACEEGIGIGGFHGGMGDAFRGNVRYQFITGVQFMAHPGNIKRWTVQICDREDPITAGLSDFEVETEQYYMLVDPAHHWLADSTWHSAEDPWLEGRRMPVTMCKMHRQSRVFYCSLGHQPHEFEIPEVRAMIERGLVWATR